MRSKLAITAYREHPDLKYVAQWVLFQMLDDSWLVYNPVQNELSRVLIEGLTYDNLGDPYREFCTVYLSMCHRPNGLFLSVPVSKADGKALFDTGVKATSDLITRYKWEKTDNG